MSSADQIREHRALITALAIEAQQQVEQLLEVTDLADPADREAFIAAYILLATENNAAAAGMAMDLYGSRRRKALPGSSWRPRAAGKVRPNATAKNVERLIEETTSQNLLRLRLTQAMDVLVKQGSRDTITWNVRIDPSKPRWARVPSSPTPCGRCLIYASRGAVYSTEESATFRAEGGKYHAWCGCLAVCYWGRDAYDVDYDAKGLYGTYQAAQQRAAKDGTSFDRAVDAIWAEQEQAPTDS